MWPTHQTFAVEHGRAWWLLPPGERSYSAKAYEGLDVSLAAIDEAWRSGAYDGILGFSLRPAVRHVQRPKPRVRRLEPLPRPWLFGPSAAADWTRLGRPLAAMRWTVSRAQRRPRLSASAGRARCSRRLSSRAPPPAPARMWRGRASRSCTARRGPIRGARCSRRCRTRTFRFQPRFTSSAGPFGPASATARRHTSHARLGERARPSTATAAGAPASKCARASLPSC